MYIFKNSTFWAAMDVILSFISWVYKKVTKKIKIKLSISQISNLNNEIDKEEFTHIILNIVNKGNTEVILNDIYIKLKNKDKLYFPIYNMKSLIHYSFIKLPIKLQPGQNFKLSVKYKEIKKRLINCVNNEMLDKDSKIKFICKDNFNNEYIAISKEKVRTFINSNYIYNLEKL